MAKVHIVKSQETIDKELAKVKIEELKTKKDITNDELKDLLIFILNKLESN